MIIVAVHYVVSPTMEQRVFMEINAIDTQKPNNLGKTDIAARFMNKLDIVVRLMASTKGVLKCQMKSLTFQKKMQDYG